MVNDYLQKIQLFSVHGGMFFSNRKNENSITYQSTSMHFWIRVPTEHRERLKNKRKQ